jgi:hypothetical protein
LPRPPAEAAAAGGAITKVRLLFGTTALRISFDIKN